MGYTTNFSGSFTCTPALTIDQTNALKMFANEDHRGDPECPSIWCQWVPTQDGTGIEWDEGEKFYDYTEWIQYIVDHFLIPWGVSISGEVIWSGEELGDSGVIYAKNNKVKAVADVVTRQRPEGF